MTPPPDERFAVITRARRVWAIGAIHADATRLTALHAALLDKFEPGDRLVYLGNYMGVGAETIATLDELVRFRRALLALLSPYLEAADIVYLRGAHEEMWQKLLQLQFAVGPAQALEWMLGHGVDPTIRAYGGNPDEGRLRAREGVLVLTRWTTELRDKVAGHPGHADILNRLKRAAFTEGGELLYVHAGVDPTRPVTEQGDTFWWGSGYFSKITEPYQGFRRVVRGYDRDHGGVALTDFTATIDGGCGFGGPLIGACITLAGEVEAWIEA